MNYKLIVNKDSLLKKDDFVLYTGNLNVYTLEFEFDNSWDNYIKFAVFIKGDLVLSAKIDNNQISVPQQMLTDSKNFRLGVYGTNSEDLRISTMLITVDVEKGAYSSSEAPDSPTPDAWEELFKNSIPLIKNNNWFLYDPISGEYKDTKIQAYGYTPKKGVDYFTEEDLLSMGIGEALDEIIDMELSHIEVDNILDLQNSYIGGEIL